MHAYCLALSLCRIRNLLNHRLSDSTLSPSELRKRLVQWSYLSSVLRANGFLVLCYLTTCAVFCNLGLYKEDH
jgi:hypothetical protein